MPGTVPPGDPQRFVGVRLTVGRVEVALALSVLVILVGYTLSGEGLTGIVAVLMVVPAGAIAVLSIWWLVRGPGRRR